MNIASPHIEQLAELVGFHKSYTNSFGSFEVPKTEALHALLSAMGYDLTSDDVAIQQINTLQEKEWRSILPSTHIIKSNQGCQHIPISLANNHQSHDNKVLYLTITTEQKTSINHEINMAEYDVIKSTELAKETFYQYHIPLPELPEGYHQLSIKYGQQQGQCHLIVAPEKCYSVKEAHHNKMWGYTAQLYALRSENNFGMGDFNDLNNVIINAAKQGASSIGLNPLHPLYQNNPAHISPYSPTSRCFLNTLYIDIKSIPNFNHCEQALTLYNSEEFQQKLTQARASDLIDYPAVAEIKYGLLELLFNDFINSDKAIYAQHQAAFSAYISDQGKDLLQLATFEALYEHFRAIDNTCYHWKSWPVEYQTPSTSAVKDFQQTSATRIHYFMYLQWIAHEQLSSATRLATTHDMPIGLYLDLAVGCDGAGVDVWSNQDIYVAGASIGAPPDAMNTLGQNWGLTPMNPVALKEQGYLPLIKALRSNMQYAGALRIDHILGLMRQYWIAPEMQAHEGVYITFPLDDILSIIALESRRTNCVVIGEDLGTVPEGFGDIMMKSGLLSYKVLYFERWWESGLFKRPEVYPSQSMVTVSTHDLPTLAGWWSGRDLTWKQSLNLYPNDTLKNNESQARGEDRHFLIATLKDVGILPSEHSDDETNSITTTQLNMAVQEYIASTASHLQLIPLEDALELIEQVNIPGTVDEHPNWRQKLPITIEHLWNEATVNNIKTLMNKVRPK